MAEIEASAKNLLVIGEHLTYLWKILVDNGIHPKKAGTLLADEWYGKYGFSILNPAGR